MSTTYDGGRTTGFASPASDSLEGVIDLGPVLGLGRPSRYLWRFTQESWLEHGLCSGDILLVDMAMQPINGGLVVAVIDGECVLALYRRRGRRVCLSVRDGSSRVYTADADDELSVWGVVDGVVRVGLAQPTSVTFEPGSVDAA